MFHWLEKRPFLFAVGVFLVVAFAGLVEIVPDFAQASRPLAGTKPHTLLQIAGREIYIQNSCNSCHSQMIRPFKSETDRYGAYSKSGEYAYDRPFLWGSERTGPDLHRVGNYRTTDWHENHMWNPRSVVPGSIMPQYKYLFTNTTDMKTAYAECLTDKKVFGVPYDKPGMPKLGNSKADFPAARKMALDEAKKVAANMKNQNVKDMVNKGEIPQIVALIAYMNSLH